MKNRLILLLAVLLIGGSFSVLLVRLASVERENTRQREQIAVMRESASKARAAFDRMQSEQAKGVIGPDPTLTDTVLVGGDEDWIRQQAAKIRRAEADKQVAIKSLDAEIKTLEKVSKER